MPACSTEEGAWTWSYEIYIHYRLAYDIITTVVCTLTVFHRVSSTQGDGIECAAGEFPPPPPPPPLHCSLLAKAHWYGKNDSVKGVTNQLYCPSVKYFALSKLSAGYKPAGQRTYAWQCCPSVFIPL